MTRMLVILVFLAMNGLSQTPPQLSGGMLNGRGWNAYQKAQKASYLMGIHDALGTVKDAPSLSHSFPTNLSVGESILAVDRFYEEPENLSIMVMGALRVVALKINGGSQVEVDAETVRLKKIDLEMSK